MNKQQEVELSMKIADVVGDAFECGKKFNEMSDNYAKLLSKSLASQQALKDFIHNLLENSNDTN